MRIHIIMREPSHSDPEPCLFRSPLVESRLGFLPLAGSALAHTAAVGFLWFVAAHLSWFGSYTVAWQAAYRVDPIRLRVPEPIYFRPAPAPKKQASRPRPALRKARPAEPGGSQPAAAPATAARRPFIPPQIELPSPRTTANEPDVILQPALPVQTAPLTAAVPALAFWARQTPEVPKPRRRELVIPGRSEAPAAPPTLDAPPVLAIPNREPVLSDINMALAPDAGTARLTVPNSATVPIRLRNTQGDAQGGSFDVSQGSPVNLIAITGAVRPAGNVIEVPRGLQQVPASDGGGNGRAEAGARSANGDPSHDGTAQGRGRTAGAGAGGTSQGRAGSGSGPGSGAGSGSGSAQTGRGPGSPRGAPGAGSSSGTATGNGTAGTGAGTVAHKSVPSSPAAPAPAESAGAVTRMVHPANGVFDVVIMQSAVRDDLPETAGMLSGTPVYTVYLRVGDQREWLLEYCIPAVAKPQNMYQIDVGDPGEISPPYPMTTVVPNAVLGQRNLKYVVLHGFITAAGRFRDVARAGPAHSLAAQLLPALSEWQFRPALRNKKAVEVEILLLVPPRS